MNKEEQILIKNIVEKLKRDIPTYFLDQREFQLVKPYLKGLTYQIYYPYESSEKVIIYLNKQPEITLYQIITSSPLTHPQILGSLFSLSINKNIIGDIIVDNDKYYIMVISSMSTYLKSHLTFIGNNYIELEERSLAILKSYQRTYQELEIIVSSTRIDTIIAKITNQSRSQVEHFFNNKEVILNYQIVTNDRVKLKEGDIFSIRKYGKYQFECIKSTTKSNNLILVIKKYL